MCPLICAHASTFASSCRSLQQKRRRNAVGGVGGHTEVASAAFHGGSSDKGKKRACDESSRARQGAKRPLLLASSPAAPHREGRAEAAFPGGSSTRSAGKAEDLGGPELREERSAEKQTLRGAKGRAGRSKVEEDESQGKSADAEGKGRL